MRLHGTLFYTGYVSTDSHEGQKKNSLLNSYIYRDHRSTNFGMYLNHKKKDFEMMTSEPTFEKNSLMEGLNFPDQFFFHLNRTVNLQSK